MLSQVDSKKLYLKKEKFYLNEMVDELLEDINQLAIQNSIDIDTNLKEFEIYADKEKIKEVFDNLLTNAIKYSGMGSKIEIKNEFSSKNIQFSVSDNGAGISNEHLGKIFDRFYLAHDYLNHKQGTGLGLAIVKNIVESHGGKVTCESQLGEGTIFNVLIPKSIGN